VPTENAVIVKPDPLVIPWQGRQLRIRHDDPYLGTYTHAGQAIRATVELASDVQGLRLVMPPDDEAEQVGLAPPDGFGASTASLDERLVAYT